MGSLKRIPGSFQSGTSEKTQIAPGTRLSTLLRRVLRSRFVPSGDSLRSLRRSCFQEAAASGLRSFETSLPPTGRFSYLIRPTLSASGLVSWQYLRWAIQYLKTFKCSGSLPKGFVSQVKLEKAYALYKMMKEQYPQVKNIPDAAVLVAGVATSLTFAYAKAGEPEKAREIMKELGNIRDASGAPVTDVSTLASSLKTMYGV